jgi:cystathionine beta-synthase
VTCVLADPVGSVLGEYARSRKLQKPEKFLVEGVGKGSVPGCMNIDIVDEVIEVNNKVGTEAF